MQSQIPRLWTKFYIIALIASFGISLNRNFLMSTLSIYTKQVSSTDIYTGLVTGVFTLAALSVRLFAGKILDQLGRKKVLIIGLCFTIAALIGYCITDQIFFLLAFRAIDGIGFGITSTAIATMITDIIPEKRLLEGIGYSGIGTTITTAIGPSIALAVIGEHYQNFFSLFILCLFVSIITLIIAFRLSYEKREASDLSKRLFVQPKQSSLRSFLSLSVAIPILLLFLVSTGQSTYISFAALYGISLEFTGVGLFFTANAIGVFLSRLFASRIVDKWGNNKVIILCLVIFALSLSLTSWIASNWVFIMIGFISGLAFGVLLPLLNVYILSGIPSTARGTANALYYSGIDVGYGLGSIMWGLVASHLGYSTIYLLAAILIVLSLVMYTVYLKIADNEVRKE